MNHWYESFSAAIRERGCFTNGLMHEEGSERTIVCSSSSFDVAPQVLRGNSFWVTKLASGWYIGTWGVRQYRLPDERRVVELCADCCTRRPGGTCADFDDQLKADFELIKVSEDEFDRAVEAHVRETRPCGMKASMSTVITLRDEVLREIDRAFGDVGRGNGMTLHEADLEGTGTEERIRLARAQDTEMSWREVPDRVIEDHSSVLSFLDEEGLRYYLPAYMSFASRRYLDSDSVSVNAAIYACARWVGLRDDLRWQVFNPEQARVICRFLAFMAEHADGPADGEIARRALKDYSGRFCE